MKSKNKHREIQDANLIPYKKGQSGNPKGRPPIPKSERELRDMIRAIAPEIITALARKAKGGKHQQANILLKKILPDLMNVKHSGNIENGPIEDLSGLSDEELRQWAEIKRKINASAAGKPGS